MVEIKDLDALLPLVQRPSRYVNSEWNSVHPTAEADVNVCFCFPDLYELGASNLGLEILYHIVNACPDARAERCYAVAEDMDAILRKNTIDLFSLESKRSLKEFDIIGFSLQYELCATNVLAMLDLARIPLLSAERNDLFPLVIGGGPVTANPEPYADFFDAFVIGDGEEVILEIIEIVKNLKKNKSSANKKEALKMLARLPGVYVPSLYSVSYNPEGTVQAVSPISADIPQKIHKRTVNLEKAYFPTSPIVPFIQTVHDRLNIEIARGCAQRCRFCQASKYYWPYRVRSKERILALMSEGLSSTGYEEVSLSALSCTEYKDIEALLSEINTRYASHRLHISLPSLRCDQFSLKIAGNLGSGKRPNLTFAPEAGSDRLRGIIGKNLTDGTIKRTLALADAMGWRLIKLYFMIGLPSETEDDVQAIIKLVRSIKGLARHLNFNIAVSCYVPKAQTPFQWVAMAKEEVLKPRLNVLLKNLPASVKHSSLNSMVLEGLFARGDRRLARVIARAWKKGCRFDQWKEKLKFSVWLEALQEEGIEKEFYLYRERQQEEILPWEHIVFAEKKDLWDDASSRTDNNNDGVSPDADPSDLSASAIQPHLPKARLQSRAVERIRLRFSRHGMVKYISHLEQIELFRRLARRLMLPLTYTLGFHPQPRISFGPAVSVGYESQCEYMELELAGKVDFVDLEEKTKKYLPRGYGLVSVKRAPLFFPSLNSLINMADYLLQISVADEVLKKFMQQEKILIDKKKKNRNDTIDVKPLIRDIRAQEGGVYLQLRFGPKRTVKPEAIVQRICGLTDDEVKRIPVTRMRLLIEKNDGTVTEP